MGKRMYNGIGLPTPRGSGTSGHIQRNRSTFKSSNKFLNQNSEKNTANEYAKPFQNIRFVNKKLLEHKKKLVEHKGYTSLNKSIEQDVQNIQRTLEKKCPWKDSNEDYEKKQSYQKNEFNDRVRKIESHSNSNNERNKNHYEPEDRRERRYFVRDSKNNQISEMEKSDTNRRTSDREAKNRRINDREDRNRRSDDREDTNRRSDDREDTNRWIDDRENRNRRIDDGEDERFRSSRRKEYSQLGEKRDYDFRNSYRLKGRIQGLSDDRGRDDERGRLYENERTYYRGKDR